MDQHHSRGQSVWQLVAAAWATLMGDKRLYARFVGKGLLYALFPSACAYAAWLSLKSSFIQGDPLLLSLVFIGVAGFSGLLIRSLWFIRLDEHLVLGHPLVMKFGNELWSQRLWSVFGWRVFYVLVAVTLAGLTLFLSLRLKDAWPQPPLILLKFAVTMLISYGVYILYLEGSRAIFSLRDGDAGWEAMKKRKPVLFVFGPLATALFSLPFEHGLPLLPSSVSTFAWGVSLALAVAFDVVVCTAEGLCMKDVLAGHPLPGRTEELAEDMVVEQA